MSNLKPLYPDHRSVHQYNLYANWYKIIFLFSADRADYYYIISLRKDLEDFVMMCLENNDYGYYSLRALKHRIHYTDNALKALKVVEKLQALL